MEKTTHNLTLCKTFLAENDGQGCDKNKIKRSAELSDQGEKNLLVYYLIGG